MIFLLYVYTNILCYSSIIYICSMHVVYFLHNFIRISYFHPFIILSYTNQCVVTRNALSYFLWCLVLSALLCCFCLLVILHFFGRVLFLSLSEPFLESSRSNWEPFWDPFSVDKFEFSKSIGEVTTDWFKNSESIGEVAVDQSKFIFDESPVNIESVDWSFVSTKGGRTIVWCCTSSINFLFACWRRFWRV